MRENHFLMMQNNSLTLFLPLFFSLNLSLSVRYHSVCLSLSLSLSLSVSLSSSPSVYLSDCLSVCLSVCLFPSFYRPFSLNDSLLLSMCLTYLPKYRSVRLFLFFLFIPAVSLFLSCSLLTDILLSFTKSFIFSLLLFLYDSLSLFFEPRSQNSFGKLFPSLYVNLSVLL